MADLPAPPHKPKSMREFDYFRDSGLDGANQSDVDALKKVRLKRTLTIHGVMTVLVTVTVFVFAWNIRSLILYNLRQPELVDLGRADERDGKGWPVESYVKLRGVTENKGAHAHFVRGLSWNEEYWYVHLIGTPVFVEVPAGKTNGKLEAYQDLVVEGRLIDLTTSPEHAKVIEFFGAKLNTHIPDHPYLVQGGLAPNQLTRYLVGLLVLVLLPIVNGWVWYRTYKRWQQI